MAHILNLKRDPALTKDLIGTTLGTATLLSKDKKKVLVPVAPLLSSSKLIRTIVAESHLHPIIHGPLILSCDVSTEVLVGVRDILGTGDTCTSSDNIEELKQVLSMMGVEADLSQGRNNEGYFDHLPARDEGVKLEIENSVEKEIFPRDNDIGNVDQQGFDVEVTGADINHIRRNSVHEDDAGNDEYFEYFDHLSARDEDGKLKMIIEMPNGNDEENCMIGIDEHENSVEKETPRDNDIVNVDQQGFDIDMSHNRRSTVHEDDAGNGEETIEIPEMDKYNTSIGGHEHIRNYSVKNCQVSIQKLRKFHDKSKHVDKTCRKEKLNKCRVCHYYATNPSALKIHMRKHTGEKPYTCPMCSSAFSIKQSLTLHMRTHSGEKPYTCAICPSAFSRKPYLEVHMRRHTGEKPYTCAICPSAFSQKTNLGVHMRMHTGEKPYTCASCGLTFRQKVKLLVHMRKHTAENSTICDYATATSKEFQ